MFRCITELKGLAIDIDNFSEENIENWHILDEKYKCIFITSDQETENIIEKEFGVD